MSLAPPPVMPPQITPAARRWALFLLFCAYTINYVDRQVITVLQEPIKADLKLSDTQLGLMTGLSFALFYAVMGVPIARLADRRSRKAIIAWCMALWSGMTALCATANSFAAMLLYRVGVGVGEAGLTPPAHSLISDYYEPHRRGSALAIYSAAGTVGVGVGFLLGGWVNELLGWRAAVLIAGLPGLALALVIALTMREPARGRFDEPTAPASTADAAGPSGGSLLALLREPGFVLLAMAAALHGFVIQGHGAWIPSFLARLHGMSTGEIGSWLALISVGPGLVGLLAFGYFYDWLVARRPRARIAVPLLACALYVPCGLLALLSRDTGWALVGIAGSFVVAGAYLPPIIAAAHTMVPASLRASVSALVMLVISLIGLGLGPLAIGALSDLWTPAWGGEEALRRAMVAVVPAELAVAALLALALHRERRNPRRSPEPPAERPLVDSAPRAG